MVKPISHNWHLQSQKKPKQEKYYFEAVEIVKRDYFKKETEDQYLALCPTCSARYKEYVKTNESKMKNLLECLKGNPKNHEIEIMLDKKFILKFVENHIIDLKPVLNDI